MRLRNQSFNFWGLAAKMRPNDKKTLKKISVYRQPEFCSSKTLLSSEEIILITVILLGVIGMALARVL